MLLSQCRAVLAHSRALAGEVIGDRMPLDSAIKQMQREREASSSIEAKMDRLREQAPDLAQQVTDETLTPGDADGALHVRLA
jgi:hypothetical protein